MSVAGLHPQALYFWRSYLAQDVDGLTRRRPLALLHSNPDRTAWVRLRHFDHAADALFDRLIFLRAGWDEGGDVILLAAMRAMYRAAEAVAR